MKPIIEVTDLGKKYRIGAREEAYSTLRETLVAAAGAPLRKWRDSKRSEENTFWALSHVSFEVSPGDVVGIIGRNGAGKTTLLKVLARITEPTTGTIKLYGRVASLLEVGTGFHPELTGRENVYLNGAILGMRREEIERKFDEIVAFAELDQFIDTAVKRYSSGMYMRLAFAVAAYLEPEILLIDEVLAVGDAAFQKKCLGRMRDVAGEGRTVLFVSHNMAAVSALCSKAMVLNKGVVEFPLGHVHEAVQRYLLQVNEVTDTRLAERTDRQGKGRIRIIDFAALSDDGSELAYLVSGQEVEFRILYRCFENPHPRNIDVAIGITSSSGVFVSMLSNQIASQTFPAVAQEGYWSCTVKKLPLAPGTYTLNLIVRQNDVIQDWIQEAATIAVEAGDFFSTGRIPPPTHGGVFIEQEWAANSTTDDGATCPKFEDIVAVDTK